MSNLKRSTSISSITRAQSINLLSKERTLFNRKWRKNIKNSLIKWFKIKKLFRMPTEGAVQLAEITHLLALI